MTIYIDSDYKVHTTDTGGLTAEEEAFFDDKCETFIEGYRLVPAGETWTREDGEEFPGEMLSPWKDMAELEAAQYEYEHEQLAALKTQNADMAAALAVLGVGA